MVSVYCNECGSTGLWSEQELAGCFLFDSVTDMLCDLEVQTPLVRWGLITQTYFAADQMKSLSAPFRCLQPIINAPYTSLFLLFCHGN